MSYASILRLRGYGLVEMSPTGHWEPSRRGRELLEDLLTLELLSADEAQAAARVRRDPSGMMDRDVRAGRQRERTA